MKDTKKKNLLVAGLAVATSFGLGCTAVNASDEDMGEQLEITNEEINSEINENVGVLINGFLEIDTNIPEAGRVAIDCTGYAPETTGADGKYMKYFTNMPSFTLTASENDGYVFIGWYENNVLKSTNYQYVCAIPNSGMHLTAKYERTYKFQITNDEDTKSAIHVTYSARELPVARDGVSDNSGSINNAFPETYEFLDDTIINITLDEYDSNTETYVKDGYTFKGWYYTDSNKLFSSNRNIVNFQLTDDIKIEPRYEKIDITSYLFNSTYYADMNKDVRDVFGYDEDLLKKHYELYGIKEGRQASPIFNAEYYLNANPELKTLYGEDGYEEAYEHFVNYGAAEGKVASQFYNVSEYWINRPYLKTSVYYSRTASLINFATMGLTNGYNGWNFNVIDYRDNIARKYIKNKIGNDYVRYYADVQGAVIFDSEEIDIEDYMFDVSVYYYANPDLQAAFGFNPELLKLHYDLYGKKEGRVASYVFNAKYYLEHNSDLISAFGANGYEMAYLHFINYGINEGRVSSQFFDAKWYVENNENIELNFDQNYSKALEYFVTTGLAAGDVASEEFNVIAYRTNNADLSAVFATDYVKFYNHYIAHGKAEGRVCTE